MRRPRRSFGKPALALLALVVTLSLVEFTVASLDIAPGKTVLLQVWGASQDRELEIQGADFRFHRRWLWEPNPSAAGESADTNRACFRGPWAPREKQRTLRIATLGDSSTYGLGVEASENWSRQLETRLRESGIDAEVLNFGCVGFSVVQGHQLYVGRVRDYQPDIVIAAFGAVNDQFTPPSGLTDAEKVANLASLPSRINQTLARYDAWRWLQTLFAPDGESEASRGTAVCRVPLDEFKQTLRNLCGEIRGDGHALVLVSPARSKKGEESFVKTVSYTMAVNSVAEELDIPVVDVHGAFRQREIGSRAASDAAGQKLFVDAWHPSRYGHALYAELVSESLQEAGLLAASR